MSYAGQIFQIPCNVGGLNNNENADLIPPQSMVQPSRNINLNKGGREKRGGTSVVNNTPTAIPSTPKIGGLINYLLRDGSNFVVVGTEDGKLYKDTPSGTGDFQVEIGSATWDATNKLSSFEIFENVLYAVNGEDLPQTWDGAAGTTSDITTNPADWSGTDMPDQFVKHGRGQSERMFAKGVATQPQRIYYSNTGDAEDWTTGGGLTGSIDIETGDGFGITGMVEFADNLICFGKRTVYILDDSDTDPSNWGYTKAPWEGGAAHHKVIVKTPFDIYAMGEDGEIYSIRTAQEFGDYKSASLTSASFMHEWIKEFLDLTNIADFHAVYDPTLRAVKWFVRRQTLSRIDTALVYFIDRPLEDAWMVHDNQVNTNDVSGIDFNISGYEVSASTLVRDVNNNLKIYTGGWDDGYVWELETANKSDMGDNTVAFASSFRTPRLNFENPRLQKRYDRLWVIAKEQGNFNLDIDWWVDNVQQTQVQVDLSPDGSFVLNTGVLGTDTLGGGELIDTSAELGVVGKRIRFEVSNNRAGEDYFISQLLIDHKPLGIGPE